MIANVQALRFLAAFWVVLFHARPPVIPEPAMPALAGWLQSFAAMGFAGVDIFFVISGAIMAESTRAAQPAPLAFVTRRFARIYCGWWPFFLLYLMANIVYRGLGEKDLAGSFFLVPLPHFEYLVPVVWTLSFELYFYLVLGGLLALPRERIRRAVALWAGAAVAFTLWAVLRGDYRPDRFGEMTLAHTFFLSPLVVEFAAGFLLCDWLRARPRGQWAAWLAAGIGFGAAGWAYQAGLDGGEGMAGVFHFPERVVLLGGAALCIVAAAIAAPPLVRADGPWVALGDASYSLYLCHILFLGTAYYVIGPLEGFWRATIFVAMLAAVVAYAWLHYRWIERPLYRMASARTRPALPFARNAT